MTDRFESILDESISAMQAGVPIEEILAEVPDYATELRPLLYAATVLADPDPKLVPEERKAALRSEYLERAAELPPVSPSLGERVETLFKVIKRRMTREAVMSDLLTVSVTVALTLVMTALILSFAATDSVPGDLLYGVKRTSENVQLLLTFSDEQQQLLKEQFNQRRKVEINQLIQLKRAAVVQFRGIVDVKGENLWIIDGYTIFLPEDSAINGNPQEGDRVEVVGLLRTNSVLVADSIKKIN